MKKNISNFYRFIPAILLLALIGSGCQHKGRFGTPLSKYGANVSDDSIGTRPRIDNVPPIGPGPTFNPNNTTPIPVTEGALPTVRIPKFGTS